MFLKIHSLGLRKSYVRISYRNEMLICYKNCKTFPKDLHLNFNLSLYKEDRNLKRTCNFILRAAASKIQDQITKALNIKISSLRQKLRNLRKSVAKRTNKEQFKSLECKIKKITDKERAKTKQRQIHKYNRDNAVITTYNKKNRRFSRKQFCAKLKEMKKTRRVKQKQNIERINETAPDQNTINLPLTELSESHKSLLRKGPTFVPTSSDVNWYEVRRDFDKFVNQLNQGNMKSRNFIRSTNC